MRVLLINSNLKDDILAADTPSACAMSPSAAEVAGHEVRVLDLCFKRRIQPGLEKAILGFSPQVIGVSLRNLDNVNMLRLITYLPPALEIVQKIRSLTDAPLVLGGSGASLDPQGVLEFLQGDYLIVSEGEKSFVALLEALNRGESPAQIPGVGNVAPGEVPSDPAPIDLLPLGKSPPGEMG